MARIVKDNYTNCNNLDWWHNYNLSLFIIKYFSSLFKTYCLDTFFWHFFVFSTGFYLMK